MMVRTIPMLASPSVFTQPPGVHRPGIQIICADWWENHLQQVLPDWSAAVLKAATLSTGPFAIVCANRSQSIGIRRHLAEHGGGCFGIDFLTPSDLRRVFIDAADNPPDPISDDHAKLLLAAFAETRPDDPTSRAIARGPDDLFNAMESLIRAGHPLESISIPSARALALELQAHLVASDRATSAMLDRWIARRPAVEAFESLLVFGFDGSHWPLGPLLRHAVAASRASTICLLQPFTRSEGPDQLWVNTWSQLLARDEQVELLETSADHRPFHDLIERMEFVRMPEPDTPAPAKSVGYLGGRDMGAEADAVVAQVLEWLRRNEARCIGILVPPQSLVLHEIRIRLRDLAIPYFDGIGQRSPVQPAFDRWHRLLDFIEDPKLPQLIGLLDSLTFADSHDGEASAIGRQALRDELLRAFKQVHVDDLKVIAAVLERSPTRNSGGTLEWMRSFSVSARAVSPSEHVAMVLDAMRITGLDSEIPTLAEAARELTSAPTLPVSIRPFVKWLRALPIATSSHRPPDASHPFARLHLLPYSQAWGRSWSHLVFAGMNQHEWPPREADSAFLKDERIEALNAAVVVSGAGGEGDEIVDESHSLVLSMQHRHAVHHSQWCGLLSSVGEAAAIAFARINETQPDRQLIPGEFLTRLHHCDTGEVLNDASALRIVDETVLRFGRQPFQRPTDGGTAPVRQTGIAFTDRRCPATPFNKYLFGLSNPPIQPVRLSCRAWESAVRDPAPVWLAHVLGVNAKETPFEDQTERQWRGILVHRWLATALASGEAVTGLLRAFPDPDTVGRRYDEAAVGTLRQLEGIFSTADRTVPTWLWSLWQDARHTGFRILEQLGGQQSHPFVATEFTLPGESTVIDFGTAGQLPVHGRLDLVLAGNPAAALSDIESAWVIDFKTGGTTAKVKADKLEETSGVQLLLYGLALRTLGIRDVKTALVGPRLAPADSFDTATTRTAQRIWQRLCGMQRTGVFGMRGALRDDYRFSSPMPIATLPIEPEILEAKSRLPVVQPKGGRHGT